MPLARLLAAALAGGLLAAATPGPAPAAPPAAHPWTSPGAAEPWVALTLERIATTSTNPPRAARALAVVSVAARDAAVAAAPLRGDAEHPAVAGAAARVLAELFPGEAAPLAALEEEAVGAVLAAGRVEERAARRAQGLGHAAALRLVRRARADGAGPPTSVSPPAGPALWVPTPPGFAGPLEPQAGTWRTWALRHGAELRPPPPPAAGSSAYAAEVRAVHDVSRTLTARQREVAAAWADGPGTRTPPGHWNDIALELLRDEPRGPVAATRLLARLNTAQADAFVACWDAKYAYWSERPVTAVRRELDPAWLPLLVTPPFPAYPSGHATTSGAAAEVLAAHVPAQAARLRAQAEEAAVSRLYGGIHFPVDSSAGLELGRRVGELVLARGAPSPP